MRLEAKHREASQYMHGVASRKNVALTVAIKAQLKMSNGYLTNVIQKTRFCMGHGSFDQLSNNELFENFKYILDENMCSDKVFVSNCVTLYNKRYALDDIIQLLHDSNDNALYQIHIIFEFKDKIYIICKELKANLCEIFYTVQLTIFFKIIDLGEHKISSPSLINTLNDEQVVRIKEF